MATLLFSALIPEIAPHVHGVPNPVATHYIRKVVTDLCERAKVWRVQLADVVLTPGDYTYDLVSPVAGTEVSVILDAKMLLTAAGTTRNLGIISDDQARVLYPLWPDLNALTEPRSVTRSTSSEFHVAPVPGSDDTYTLKLFAAIRPTPAATGWDEALFNEFRRAVFHGVLHELMMMPDRPWSNDKLAMYHGKQWDYLLYNARAKANKGFSPASVSVKMNPWA